MKSFKLTSKNDGSSQDFLGRAKRAGKSLILGFQEKILYAMPYFDQQFSQLRRESSIGPNTEISKSIF